VEPYRCRTSIDAAGNAVKSGGWLGIPERRIVGFHPDQEGYWIAELECGHTQHVRHDPPWQLRPWVLTEEGRAGRLGTTLPCRRCAEETLHGG
jgi:hypothetical protein